MNNLPQHVIIYSHGFGTRQDDVGLFPDIARHFPDMRHIMFDYNSVSESGSVLTVPPFSVQANKLEDVVAQVQKASPGCVVDIIAHSQGCLVVALAKLEHIRKVIFLAPKVTNDIEKTAARFAQRPGSVVNLEGESTLVRSDGSTTIVGAEFWRELQAVHPESLFNEFGKRCNLTIIRGAQDTIATGELRVGEGITLLTIDGDHSFNGTRELLIPRIAELLIAE